MKRNDVKARNAVGISFYTHVIANPANTREWIVFFKKDAGRSFFLVDENEDVESFAHLDGLIDELRALGIKNVEIHL
ncbi:hypothetical protein H681_06230 [Pseudomonas sp. ATCC 13867]|uniref:hypothetical protein n=1 Tax=Pseudomonas sp. ATCC 13867 TaxID=1294143 RepID=UPI0002C4F2AF|nr:hypothetical protein [Pseudomonas sp. ATCC 13867]AGI23126.1 hypothetical protein H681_06230 [Pseudomonas sp. ATCC 13867]RFQ37096.1 hypothetical protein D0N87_08050 [Pseudomonas sp. ATCC 13867]